MGSIISLILWAIVAGLVIYIVGRLNLGLSVRNFTSAILAAIVIALVSWVIVWLLSLLGISLGGGLLGAIIMLIVAAVVLMISDRFLPGMEVHGFTGALIAAIAIAVIVWILGLIGIAASPFSF